MIDVLGIGGAAVDDLVIVQEFPQHECKVPILERHRLCGGLAATALVTAAKLGVHASYAATVGEDELSDFVLSELQRQGVDTRHCLRDPAAGVVYAIVMVDRCTGGRTILADSAAMCGPNQSFPSADLIRSARVLLVDRFGMPGMIRAARIAREAGIPVVADIERSTWPRLDELLALVDHLIVPRAFAESATGESDPARAVSALRSSHHACVCVTDGERGAWFAESAEIQHQHAFPVDTVDTTGCGDVFHGAYAASIAGGMPIRQAIRRAAACAALKATGLGGQTAIPDGTAVDRLLERT
jgi:sulfofructose kinase